jgi:hypothetical protein
MSLPGFTARPGETPVLSEGVVAFDFDCEAGKMGVVLTLET